MISIVIKIIYALGIKLISSGKRKKVKKTKTETNPNSNKLLTQRQL